MLHDIALYKFNVDIDIDITGMPILSSESHRSRLRLYSAANS